MASLPPVSEFRLRNTVRLIASRHPTTGILDRIASPEDLDAIIELDSWTNDRISNSLGVLHLIPPEEWVTGRPLASVIMAAFCHPNPAGSRFNGPDRGAWYAGLTLETAHAECVWHRTTELAEIGVFETFVQQRAYLADFRAPFHDVRAGYAECQSPVSYTASQRLGRELLESGSNGVVYRSARQEGGQCVACFRPGLVANVREGGCWEYRWHGTPVPQIRKLAMR